MAQPDSWYVCPKCGALGVTTDPRFNRFLVHCKWCDLAPRPLAPEELTALKEHPSAADSVRARRNVNMSHEGDRYVFTEWGARSKQRSKAHYRRHDGS